MCIRDRAGLAVADAIEASVPAGDAAAGFAEKQHTGGVIPGECPLEERDVVLAEAEPGVMLGRAARDRNQFEPSFGPGMDMIA